MKQSKLESLVETVSDIALAFFISWAFWVFVVAPWQDIPADHQQSFEITCAFTALALVRRYLTRRFFENRFHAAIKSGVAKLYKAFA